MIIGLSILFLLLAERPSLGSDEVRRKNSGRKMLIAHHTRLEVIALMPRIATKVSIVSRDLAQGVKKDGERLFYLVLYGEKNLS